MAKTHSANSRYAIGDTVLVNYQAKGQQYPYLEEGIIVGINLHMSSKLVDHEIVDNETYVSYEVKLKCFPEEDAKSYSESYVYQMFGDDK